MKKQLCILLTTIAIITSNTSKGQFAAASITDLNMTTSIANSLNTGNDIGEFFGEQFEVTVADYDYSINPSVGGLTYRVSGNSPLFINFTYPNAEGYLDPDVCLVANDGTVFALAVYLAYTPNGSNYDNIYVLECFRFDFGSFQFYSVGSTMIGAYSFNDPSSALPEDFEVNIDSDVIGNRKFAITWDDYSMNYVFARTGEISESEFENGCADLCESTLTIYDAGGAGNPPNEHPMPDVAFNDDKIYFTYLIAYNTGPSTWERLEVASINSDASPCPEDPDLKVEYTTGNSAYDNYDNPRIACPNINSSIYGATSADWHVVASETDYGGFWGIIGINSSWSGINYVQYYDDGTYPNSPLDITGFPEYEPVVAYSEDGNILIGWLFDNFTYGTSSTSAEIDAYYPIVINCDSRGDIWASAEYMNVPTTLTVGSNNTCGSLSIAGRNCVCASYAPSVLFSWSLDGDDVYTKIAPEGNTALRLVYQTNQTNVSLNALLFPSRISSSIPESQEFEFKMFDVLSKTIRSITGNLNQIQNAYQVILKELNTGIYLGQLESKDQSILVSGKLFIPRNN